MKISESLKNEATVQPKFELDLAVKHLYIHTPIAHYIIYNKSMLNLLAVAFTIGPN